MSLTQRQIDAMEPDKDALVSTGIPNLFIRTGMTQHTYTLVYKVAGKRKKLPLGNTRNISLKDAEKLARQELAKLDMGEDPVALRNARKNATKPITFGELVPDFIEAKREAGRAGKTIEDYLRYLGGYARQLHKRPVAEIEPVEIVSFVDKVKKDAGPAAALIAARNVSAFYNWCARRQLVKLNPAANIEKPASPKPRTRILSAEEIGRVWNAVKDRDDDWSRIIALLLLTGQRRNEIAALMWNEVDLDERVVNFDPERIKTRVQHKLPITDTMTGILIMGERREGYVFGKLGFRPFSGFSKSQRELLECLGDMETWSPHDLRRTFETQMAENEWAEDRVINSILNHAVTGVKAHYNRASYIRAKGEALQTWGRYVMKCASEIQSAVANSEAGE